MHHPFSASRRRRTAICISAMRCRRCSIPTWRARRAGGCCCASRTSTRRAAGRNSRRRSTKTWPGSASMGSAGAAAVRALRRLPRGARQARRDGPDLSELRKPRRDRAPGRRTRSAGTLAARSRRRAALSRSCERHAGCRAQAPHGDGEPYALRLDMRPRSRVRAARAGSKPVPGPPAKPGPLLPIPPPGAT